MTIFSLNLLSWVNDACRHDRHLWLDLLVFFKRIEHVLCRFGKLFLLLRFLLNRAAKILRGFWHQKIATLSVDFPAQFYSLL